MLLHQTAAGGELFKAHQLEALALKATDDFPHQAPLNPIGLDGKESAFGGHGEDDQLQSHRLRQPCRLASCLDS